MSHRELLADHYRIHPGDRVTIDGRTGFLADGSIYFTMKSTDVETVHLEQAVLAYYLLENGFSHIALPIKNMKNEWFTVYGKEHYLTYRVTMRNSERQNNGTALAAFHQIGSAYSYEPKALSSYGAWRQLWTDKLTLFEERIKNSPSKLLLDVLPYVIGMSENAIQYLRETEETESRFSEIDQGTITFLRFHHQFHREVLWPDELGYDHPARDIAEHLRALFLFRKPDDIQRQFIHDYEEIRPLSPFSLRLIYARLLFPIHLFDAMEQFFYSDETSQHEQVLTDMIARQADYEKRLRNFFKMKGVDPEEVQLIEVDWLT